MKRYISLLLGILVFIPILAQQSDYYYYYKGERVYLTVDSTRLYVVSEGEFQSQTSTYARVAEYGISSSTRSCIYDYVAPLHKQRSTVSIPEVFFSTIEIPKALNSSQYEDFLEKVKLEDDVWQVLPSFTVEGKPMNVTNNFHVKLKDADDFPKLQELAALYDIEIIGNNRSIPLWYTLSCNANSLINALDAANTFHLSGMFDFCEPEISAQILCNSNDPYYELQWNLKNTGQGNGVEGMDINVEEAWEMTKGDSVVVAVYDEPIYEWHEDLSDNMYDFSYDIQTGVPPVYNNELNTSHGTACASIIAAVQNNNKGLSGVAPNSKIMPISFTNSNVTSTQVASGFIKAADNGASVISCSWVYTGTGTCDIDLAIEYALNKGRKGLGCVVVFSTGNDLDGGDYYEDENGNFYCEDSILGDAVSFPARANPRILTVGGITNLGQRTRKYDEVDGYIFLWSSNYGVELDVVAPSEFICVAQQPKILSSYSIDYDKGFNGTSAACPHAAGVAALILSVHPELTADQVVDIIEYTAKKVRPDLYTYQNDSIHPHGTWNEEMGYGLIDAGAAVKLAEKASRTTYVRDTILTNEQFEDYDVEFENVVIEPDPFVEVDKYNCVILRSSVFVRKGGNFIIFKEPLKN